MDEKTNIRWKDSFKDQDFLNELTRFLDQYQNNHAATDEDIDEIFKNLFTYDEKGENLIINSPATENKNRDANTSDNEDETAVIDVEQKIRMMLLLKLMINDGLQLDNYDQNGRKIKNGSTQFHGNGQRASNIISIITGIPLQTCKNFISDPRISSKTKKDSITKINNILLNIGMKIRIE